MSYPGVDIVEIERFSEACRRQPRLTDRLFTLAERESLAGKGMQSWAARFAAKEAVLKALGTGLAGLSWHDIEILNQPSGEPIVVLSPRARQIANTRGKGEVRLSLTHNKTQAIAVAILVSAD